MAKVKKDDTVMVTNGREKGKTAKVMQVFPKENRIILDGLNLVRRHQKARGVARQAGIIDKEAPIQISNVMVVCPNCGKPTRIGHIVGDDGRKSRSCKKCEGVFD